MNGVVRVVNSAVTLWTLPIGVVLPPQFLPTLGAAVLVVERDTEAMRVGA